MKKAKEPDWKYKGVRLFFLSDEERSISRDPQKILFCFGTTQVTVKPPKDDNKTLSPDVSISLHDRKMFYVIEICMCMNESFN